MQIVVYSGYVSPDHYDMSYGPCYKLAIHNTEDSVIDAYKEYLECMESDDNSHGIFRAFSFDRELTFEPVSVVTDWVIK